MAKTKLSLNEIKQAILTDSRFRNLFPELSDEIKKVLQNPGCACNVPYYTKFFQYKDRLSKYFSTKDVVDPKEEAMEDNRNNWKVVNCKIDDLEEVLNKLHKFGRKQIAVARYEDEITLIVNDMGILF